MGEGVTWISVPVDERGVETRGVSMGKMEGDAIMSVELVGTLLYDNYL